MLGSRLPGGSCRFPASRSSASRACSGVPARPLTGMDGSPAERPADTGLDVVVGLVTGWMLLVWITALISGGSVRNGPEKAASISARLIKEQVLNTRLVSTSDIAIYERPVRMTLLPMLWKVPPRAGEIPAGHAIDITAVRETDQLGQRRVWMEARPNGQRNRVWIQLGNSLFEAAANLETQWRPAPGFDSPS